jgi:hypothetical protein
MKNITKTFMFKKVFKNFSTLIVPEIVGNKLHPSIYNLMTAAKQIDNDVRQIFKLDSTSFIWKAREFR